MYRTFFIDFDGTLFDNAISFNKYQNILPGVDELWKQFNSTDVIIITTARPEFLRNNTINTLNHYNLRFDYLLMGITNGKRYLINDIANENSEDKAIAFNVIRDKGINFLHKL